MTTPYGEHFEQKADMGVRGFGNTLAEALEQTAHAMFAIITELSLINPREEVRIICEDPDQKLLLVECFDLRNVCALAIV